MVEVSPLTYDGRKTMRVSAVIAALGFLVLVIGLFVDPARTWLSYLMAYVFAFAIVVGALLWLMIAYASNARWMSVIRRTTEAVVLPLPALIVLFVPIVVGLGQYPWYAPPAHLGHEELAVIAHRAPYTNGVFFVIRAVVYFVALVIAASLLRRWSVRRDAGEPPPFDADPEALLARERKLASGMLPPVGLALSFAAIDWVMTLEPVWYSSMYPVYVFAGGFLGAIALITVLTARLWARHGGGGAITPNHFHALGRLMFAFTVFWAYTGFFQAMLIRIANKPEEVRYYLERTGGTWGVVVWILILGHFALPFLFLMPKRIKFRPRAMAGIGWWLVVMQLVDVYWLVIPARAQGILVFSWLDLGALAAVIGSCVAVAAWRQHGVALIALRDPFLPKGVAYRSNL